MPTKNKKKKKHKKLLKVTNNYSKDLELEDMLAIKLSNKSVNILNKIAKHGIYGTTPEIVAVRFVDEVIQRFIEVEDIKIKL